MPNVEHSLTTTITPNITSNSSVSPPQILINSTSLPPPPAPVPQPPSASTASPSPVLQSPSTFTLAAAPPPRFANDLDDDHYFNSFPPGYRFCPHDHELVLHYLTNKVKGLPLPRNKIVDVVLYQYDPEYLDRYKKFGEKEWYFFTPRDRKYKNGSRPNRAANGGYWKATGADKNITHDEAVVGYRKALVYYTGKAPKGDKTNWIMHEFRVNEPLPQVRNHRDDMRVQYDYSLQLDEWVLCRIYKKIEKPVKNREQYSTQKYQLVIGPNDLAAVDGDRNSGTDSRENPWQQQATPPLAGFDDLFFFCNSYSAAQVPFLPETYEDPIPMLLSSDFSKGLPEEIWNPPILQFDLAETFNLYGSTEDNPETTTNLPAENLRINPSPASTGRSVNIRNVC
ncbi:NAC domain-containing protein 102-like [Populus alba x Populus x berolinensis]|uniref:NAC domain-containing protein 102-like n=1 Tax=Populus alba x Populus x berolinensis TaxID=444605 RepID=A0AAD6MGD7_9ROSI|nr:NAC domain-containing protein 102-like [Populus alba x Populus x berolinensis]